MHKYLKVMAEKLLFNNNMDNVSNYKHQNTILSSKFVSYVPFLYIKLTLYRLVSELVYVYLM